PIIELFIGAESERISADVIPSPTRFGYARTLIRDEQMSDIWVMAEKHPVGRFRGQRYHHISPAGKRMAITVYCMWILAGLTSEHVNFDSKAFDASDNRISCVIP